MWHLFTVAVCTTISTGTLLWLMVSIIVELLTRLDDSEGTLFASWSVAGCDLSFLTHGIVDDERKRKRFLAPYPILEYWDRRKGGNGWETSADGRNDMDTVLLFYGWATCVLAAGGLLVVSYILLMVVPGTYWLVAS